MSCHSPITIDVLRHHNLDGIKTTGAIPASRAHSLPAPRIAQEIAETVRKCAGITRIDKAAGYTILNQIAQTAYSARHDGNTKKHRFERRNAECLEPTRQAKDRGPTEKPRFASLVEPAAKMNTLGHAKFNGAGVPLADISIAGQSQMDIAPLRHQQSQRFDQRTHALLLGQPSCERDIGV